MSYLSLREDFTKYSDLLPSITSQELDLYDGHFQLLQQWNERINLVSRKSIGDAVAFHYADSLLMSHTAAQFPGYDYFDIGTGAGFPGLIFAIHFPDRFITLFEKSLKKQTFLSAVITQLKLTNVGLEGSIPKRLPKGFYFARAVFPRDEIFYKMKSLMEKGSLWAATRGGSSPASESIPKAFAKVREIKYSLPAGAGDRWVEILSKV